MTTETTKNKHIKVLLVEDDRNLREVTLGELLHHGFEVAAVASGEEALDHLRETVADIVLLDIRLEGIDGVAVLKRIRTEDIHAEVIIITGYPTVQNAIECMKLGAYDYIEKPYEMDRLCSIINRAWERKQLSRESSMLHQEMRRKVGEPEFIGESPATKNIMAMVERIAPADASVLITGETGTGKEVLAKTIHRLSSRSDQSFVTLDCAALHRDILERELFGHLKGSFTGASETRHGLFEFADGGTLFVDEVSEIPPEVQAKLLRAIETGEYRYLGDTRARHVDVRVIAATNRDVYKEMADGRMRTDLYHRISVVPIQIPPLRERKEDIPLLVQHYLNRVRKITRIEVSDDVMTALMNYSWPGNVRELFNVMERCALLAKSAVITPNDLPLLVFGVGGSGKTGPDQGSETSDLTLADVEHNHILSVLEQHSGNRSKAAAALGIDRKTLYQKLKHYGVGN